MRGSEKMSKGLDNIRFVFFTNQNGAKFAEITLKYFLKHNKREDLKVTLVSNKFNHDDFQFSDRVDYFDADIPLSTQVHHFGYSLQKFLPTIEEDYIFYFCDDYFFLDEMDYDGLEKLLEFIECDGVDYFGFDDVGGIIPISGFDKYQSGCDHPLLDHFYLRHPDYQYIYSVQPCIWKKDSLISVLNRHDGISLHDLDETKDYLRDTSLKTIMTDLHSCFDYYEFQEEKGFIIKYMEVCRHGCFNLPENGMPTNPYSPLVKFIYNLIKDEDLSNKPEVFHFLPRVFRNEN